MAKNSPNCTCAYLYTSTGRTRLRPSACEVHVGKKKKQYDYKISKWDRPRGRPKKYS